jgi:hypothetical protein
MSVERSRPRKAKPNPPFWGPDGRYRPPSENGELPLHLPDHLELPCNDEQWERQVSEAANLRAKAAEQRAQKAEQRAERLAAKLRELGIDPDAD